MSDNRQNDTSITQAVGGPHPDQIESTRLPDALVKQILERAIELDSQRSQQTSLDGLRSVARDLGITDESLNIAVREAIRDQALATTPAVAREQSGREERRPGNWFQRVFGRLSPWARRGIALATPLGIASSFLARYLFADGSWGADEWRLILGAVAVAAGLLIAIRPKRERFRHATIIVATYWLAFLLTLVAPLSHGFGQAFFQMGSYFVASVAVGGIIDLYRMIFRREPDENNARPAMSTHYSR